jgi:GTP-binding protein Era
MKEGLVLLLGRPNVGKSTFLNNIIGQKVAITSPKPQTTRFPIQGLYQEERGNIIFTDTPGIFQKAKDGLAKSINDQALKVVNKKVDAVIYMLDPTRRRDFEEAKVLGIARQMKAPVLLVFNKSDLEPKYIAQYRYLEDEFKDVFYISSIEHKHIAPLLNKLFELMPEKKESEYTTEALVHPILNMDSKTFVSELIREKLFIMMGEEIPYTLTVVVDEITERDNGMLYIKARILTTHDRYKSMIIGKGGRKIKEIGSYARKEIALSTNKKVFLDLSVETNENWQDSMYS